MKIHVIIVAGLISCISSCGKPEGFCCRKIDFDEFTIEIPYTWLYVPQRGDDSFVGLILGKDITIIFDYSKMGYANSLNPTLYEYLYEEQGWNPLKTLDLDSFQITEPDSSFYLENPGIHYMGSVYIADSSIQFPIVVPDVVLNHIIIEDTINGYYRKIIKSKIPENGTTGVYFEEIVQAEDDEYVLKGTNFALYANTLSAENQATILKAIESIQLDVWKTK